MTVGAVGGAVVLEVGMTVNALEDVAKEEVGLIVVVRGSGLWAADLNGAFESGEERELAFGAGGDEGSEMGQAFVLVEHGEVFFEGGATFGFGEGAEFGNEGHGGAP